MSPSPNNGSSVIGETADREIVATRVFDAPRELVWKMWTDPKHIVHWWGPKGFTNTTRSMDVRPDGVWEHVMHGPDGTDYRNRIVYREVRAPEFLSYTHVTGPIFDAYVTFSDEAAGKTRISVRMVFESAELRTRVAEEFGAVEGLQQTLGRLAEQLASFPEPVIITRTFDAPPEVVWRAWTERDQVAAWWCPHHFTNVRCEIDVRPGGTIRIDMQGPDGTIYPMSGVYHELIEPERIVMTTQAMHDAEGNPQFEILNTVTFERDGAKTKLTMRAVVVYSTEAAKFALAGMREGWAQSLDKLADAAARAMDAETFTISRLFDAPRELVFAVWTEREHLNAWWGPRGFTVIKCENDLRDGGRMHFGLQAPDGSVMWGRWMYREVLKPERLVFVSSFSDEDGGLTRHFMHETWPLEMLATISFAEEGGKTRVTVQSIPINATATERQTFADNHASMNGGWGGTLDTLANYLSEVQR